MDDFPADADRYGTWKAPAEDGALLIWPNARTLLQQTIDNGKRLRAANDIRIQNLSLPEIRQRLRAFIGIDGDAPLIATGHQAELHHPGVWAKNVLINAVAGKLSGQAFHFAVDTDAPKHLSLRWPGGAEPLSDDPRADAAAWSGLLEPPTPAHLQQIAQRFERAASKWDFQPMAPELLASMRRLSLESTNLPASLTNALHELDWNLGLRHHALLVSPLWSTEPYLAFAHHVLARASDFAADYNGALADYRQRNKIRAPGRPMPDLAADDAACEVPFWLDDLASASRSRATVLRRDGNWALVAPSGEGFVLEPGAEGWTAAGALLAWLRQRNLRLAPRALTLTTVLRLLAADQFVHGIGGGQYDQVADALIARHFHLDPPRFSVTTATLFFPAAANEERACVPCVKQEGHRLRHRILGAEKMRLVHAIAAAPRGSNERSVLFHEMQDRLVRASSTHPVLRQWEQRLQATARRELDERALFDRELFYAIQPKDRLEAMIERYDRAMAG